MTNNLIQCNCSTKNKANNKIHGTKLQCKKLKFFDGQQPILTNLHFLQHKETQN